jgi:hypothetical protein
LGLLGRTQLESLRYLWTFPCQQPLALELQLLQPFPLRFVEQLRNVRFQRLGSFANLIASLLDGRFARVTFHSKQLRWIQFGHGLLQHVLQLELNRIQLSALAFLDPQFLLYFRKHQGGEQTISQSEHHHGTERWAEPHSWWPTAWRKSRSEWRWASEGVLRGSLVGHGRGQATNNGQDPNAYAKFHLLYLTSLFHETD